MPVRLRRIRVSLKYSFFPFLARACPELDEGKRVEEMVEGVFRPHL